MATQLTPLEQVQEDAKRLTLKRIAEQEESKAWQESQDRTVSLDDEPEVEVKPEVKPKAKTTKKKGK
jgi:hypothetical protein